MNDDRIRDLTAFHRDGLLEDVVPFWMQHAPDEEAGAYFNFLDADGSVYCTDKPVWVIGRFAWLTALLYNDVERRDDWLRQSRRGIEFLEAHCFDTDGRMFYLVTREGAPLRKRRYLFTEAFGAIALAEYGRATGDEERMRRAHELYCRVLRYYQNPSLLPPKVFPRTRPMKSHAMPMILLATTQQLRKNGDDPLYKDVIDHCLDEILNDFVHRDRRALLETVGPDGEFIDTPEGRTVNPGHAIETAWFLMEEGRFRNEPALIEHGCEILTWSLEAGWDETYGGLLYFVDVDGRPCVQYEHDMKLWWPHTEALYATLLAHHLTGDAAYARWYERVHDWAYRRFPDGEHGEWYKYLHRDGSLSHTVKGNAWAGPFHLPRMQLYCWRLLAGVNGSAH